MPDNPHTREKQPSQPSENIEIPPIPKQTAGAVAGAAVGSIAGPIGAVVGGVAGALAGKAAGTRRGIVAAATKSVAKGTKGRVASRKQIPKRRAAKSRKGTGTRRRSTPGRSVRKRCGGRKKRY